MLKRKATNFMKNLDKHKRIRSALSFRVPDKQERHIPLNVLPKKIMKNWLKLILNRCLLRWRYFLEILP